MKTASKLFLMLAAAMAVQSLGSCKEAQEPLYGVCEISGTVVNDDNIPVQGAVVQALSGIDGSVVKSTSDETGKYEMKVEKATQTLYLETIAEGYENNNTMISVGYTNPIPDVSLGKASIEVDIVLHKNN